MEDKQRCPNARSKAFHDYCDLTERPSGRIKACLLETGDSCEEWDEIQAEWAAQENKLVVISL